MPTVGRVALPGLRRGPPGRPLRARARASGTTGITLPPEDRALAVALADQLGTVLANEIQN